MNFNELRSRIQDRISDSTSSTLSIIDDKINETLSEIFNHTRGAAWYKRTGHVETFAQVTGDGTTDAVSVTKGENTVKFGFSSGGLQKRMIGASLEIGSDSESYRIIDIGLPGMYGGKTHSGNDIATGLHSSWVIIDRPYQGTTNATASFTITQDTVVLRPDVDEIEYVVQLNTPRRSDPIPLGEMRTWVPDPILQGATGDPYSHHDLGRVSIDWINKYNDNSGSVTCAVTNGSHVVTFSSLDDAFSSSLWGSEGRNEDLRDLAFRVQGDSRIYVVRKGENVSGAAGTLVIRLEEPFQGTTDASAVPILGWIDSPALQFYPVPTSAMHIEYGYRIEEKTLTTTEESPILPPKFHGVLLDGSIWRMLNLLESNQASQALLRYREGLKTVQSASGSNQDRVWRLRGEDGVSVNRRVINLGAGYPSVFLR